MSKTLTSRTAEPIKMLLLGDSGTGKTGALASLAQAGYRLRIIDFDNGLDILGEALKGDEKSLARVEYETFTEKMKMIGGQALIDGIPQAWNKAMNKIGKWSDSESIDKWGLDTVLCVDSLTFASKAAMQTVLAVNGRSGKKPYQSDWGQAQDMAENMLSLLYSSAVKCHVIVLSHVAYIPIEVPTGEKDANNEDVMKVIDNKGLPMAIGKALSPRIPRYFNHSLIAYRTPIGKRVISTQPVGIVEAKSASLTVPKELPLATGLATYFQLFHKLGA